MSVCPLQCSAGLLSGAWLVVAPCRMTILCQICEAPQVLVEIMAEIVRRQKFTESFAKVLHRASSGSQDIW